MGYEAWHPELSATILLSNRWAISTYAGANIYTPNSTFALGPSGINYYLGGRVEFALNKQWYLYGNAHTTFFSGGQNGYLTPLYGQWTPAFGGGIGFKMKDAGPIEVGVTYHYNPITHRLEPSASINVFGAVNLLIRAIKKIFTDD